MSHLRHRGTECTRRGSVFLLAFLTWTQLMGARPRVPAPPRYVVHAGAVHRSYACGPAVDARRIKGGTLYAKLRKGGDQYLLVAYTEPSNPNNPTRYCGGGEESYLVWLHVRADVVLKAQVVLYQSCRETVEGDPPAWSRGLCVTKYETFRAPQTEHEAVFDSAAPEKGLTIRSRPAVSLRSKP